MLQLNDGQVARVCAREMQANDDNCLQKGAYSIEYLRPAVVPQVPTNQTEPGQRASGKIRHIADKCDTCARARNKFQKFKKGSTNGATNGAAFTAISAISFGIIFLTNFLILLPIPYFSRSTKFAIPPLAIVKGVPPA